LVINTLKINIQLINPKSKVVNCGMALKIIDHGTPEYRQMADLRNEILRKPLGLSLSPEELSEEKDDIFLAAFEEEQMLACCVLTRMNHTTVRLRQMAVRNDLQGKGIGRVLLTFAENIARDNQYKVLTMHARKTVLDFYKKSGYEAKGDEFEEVNLPHYIMEKVL
jgi:predicted GNAT family N-acyltransferase